MAGPVLQDETGSGTFKWVPLLSSPDDVPCGSPERWRRYNLPILHLIGTGEEPSVGGEFRDIQRSKEGDTEEQVICRMVGYKGARIVHLYGDWRRVISEELLLAIWNCNLTRNAVSPRLFIDGVEHLVFENRFYQIVPCRSCKTVISK